MQPPSPVRTGFSAPCAGLFCLETPLPDTPRRDASPAPWASLVLVKFTHEISHRDGRSAVETQGTQGEDETQSPMAEAREDSEWLVDRSRFSLTLKHLGSFMSSEQPSRVGGGKPEWALAIHGDFAKDPGTARSRRARPLEAKALPFTAHAVPGREGVSVHGPHRSATECSAGFFSLFHVKP